MGKRNPMIWFYHNKKEPVENELDELGAGVFSPEEKRRATLKAQREEREYWEESKRNAEYRRKRREHSGEEADKARIREAVQEHRDREKGLPPGARKAMLIAQDYKCANPNCRADITETRNQHMDHCHDTGIVRGIHCQGCNLAMGHARHSIPIVKGLIISLKKSRAKKK